MEPYLTLQSKISDKLHAAEVKLELKGYLVIRHTRMDFKINECFGLAVFGDDLHCMELVRSIVGPGYKLLLNLNQQQILIQ
jgi:hypothetical protein